MASAPPSLPVFYKDLVPLNVEQHRNWRVRSAETAYFLVKEHAVPLTVDEFLQCQRHLPIVFSAGSEPVPLALMGLNEGTNTLVDADGKLRNMNGYVPAYIRRYPWMLAKLDQTKDELSLCFDPTAPEVGEFGEGEGHLLIDESGEASAVTKEILTFCEQFEQAARRTQQFMADVAEAGLLMDGELTIQTPISDQPFIYRGFQMIDEQKLRDLRGDQLRKFSQSGMLPLLYAQLFSLQVMREIFEAQLQLGVGPVAAMMPAA